MKVVGWKSDYRSVQKLLNHLGRRTKSEGSKESYLSWLYRFCKKVGKNPDEVVGMKPVWLRENTQEFVDESGQTRGETGNLARAALAAFLKSNGFDGGEKKLIQIRGFFSPVRKSLEMTDYVPSKEEIQKMANSGKLNNNRDRAIILFLYSSGLRQGTLRALRYKDIKAEFESQTIPLKIPVYPEMKEVLPDACKGSIPYYTFINGEAREALKGHLTELESKIGKLKDEDVIFNGWTRNSSISKRHRPLSRSSVDLLVKNAAQRAGIERWKDVHPHCLRKAFDSALREDTADGKKLDTKTQEFLMGHILPGAQEHYFDRDKVESLRAEYAKLNFAPSRPLDERTIVSAFNRQYLSVAGYSNEELDKKGDLSKLTPQEVQELIKQKQMQSLGLNGNHQKIVRAAEIESWVTQGWDFVTSLPDSKAVVRLPSPA